MIDQKNRTQIIKNAYQLNQGLHAFRIPKTKAATFIGICLLFIRDQIRKIAENDAINIKIAKKMQQHWSAQTEEELRSHIEASLEELKTEGCTSLIEHLKREVLDDESVKALTHDRWQEILNDLLVNVYKYIYTNSLEGVDILSLFFVTFNKYAGKTDKNQVFTPCHIADFMAQVTEVDKDTVVLDGTCGLGTLLVSAMGQAFADCWKGRNESESQVPTQSVSKQHIYGIEIDKATYQLAALNMLLSKGRTSHIRLGSIFEEEAFIVEALSSGKRGVILMNPPYNAKVNDIPEAYQCGWGKSNKGRQDPTKGLVFLQFLSDVVKKHNLQNIQLCILLPISAAIGNTPILEQMKAKLLDDNTLDAVFSLPFELFHPAAQVQTCCMLLTLNKPHRDSNSPTFFGYYKDDGFRRVRDYGRLECVDAHGERIWPAIKNEWIRLFQKREEKQGMSVLQNVTEKDEWLCEAYMKTDYSKLTDEDFKQTVRHHLSHLVKEGKVDEIYF